MSACRLVVFDWDGTLMDSAARIVAAVRGAIECSGLEPRSEDAIRHVIGLGMREAVCALYPEMPERAGERLAATYRESFARAVAEQPARLFPGVEDTLAELEARGYLLAVATGKSRSGLMRDLEHSGLAGRFAASRTVDECASKPDPAMLRDLLDTFAVEPASALMVGDTLFDLQMARRAGVPAVGVSWGVHAAGHLLEAGPERVIDELAELPGWLAGRAADTDPA
jgi:phosphoglycolate phosphatase